MALGSIVQNALDPGTKDSLPVSAVPPIPPAKAGHHTIDNVLFSNVQKNFPRLPSTGNDRDVVYVRLPGLLNRAIRPRKFIHVTDAIITTLRTVAKKSTGTGATAGSVTAGSRVFTGDAAEDFVADSVVPGDILILTDAGGSNGRFVVVKVLTATTLRLDCPTPATDASVTYAVIARGNFVDKINRLIDLGTIELRNSSGTLVAPVTPV